MVITDHNIRDLSILIIDDNTDTLKTITNILKFSNPQYYIKTAETVSEAIELLQATFWDTILLDLSLPLEQGGVDDAENGMMLLDKINKELKLSAPIIAITGYNDEDLAEEALDKGAYYFLPKPIRAKALSAIVKNATRFQLAGFDGLTGLLNRQTFEERLKSEFERVKRRNEVLKEPEGKSKLSLIFIDGDNFKEINDTYSHLVGDQVLKIISSCFIDDRIYQVFSGEKGKYKYIIRPYDIAARFGGDEFSLFLPETSHDNACNVARRIREILQSVKLRDIVKGDEVDDNLKISISIGVATYPDPNNIESHEDLIFMADEAMYESKKARTGEIFGYDSDGKICVYR